MGLHVDRYEYRGEVRGRALLLIHGWGMHGGMWSRVAEKLALHFNVYAVDLPGHGWSRKGEGRREKGSPLPLAGEGLGERVHFPFPPSPFSLDSIVDELAAQFNEPLTVCGWSLGGQVALRWALRHPQQVVRLVMVASTPCFVRLADWRYALSLEILEEFAINLQHHYALTLKRFLSLQMRGCEQEREVLAILRDGLFSRGEPEMGALQSGLDILRDSDLRGALPEVRQPTLVLAGERDTLIPHQASQYLASRIPAGRLAMIKGAAHAPFLSHQDEFINHLLDFLGDTKA
ncbi:MAG TPA: alpha/beta fold hydrolase [Gallionella sp.]|nr:alpha/beta fold hydrolase [Gallionella sp.]